MRVVMGGQLGGPDVLSVVEREAPQPGPGQVAVKVAAARVNFMDIYHREGAGGYSPQLPFVPGAEGAGTAITVGEGAPEPASGEHAASACGGGSDPEQAVVPRARALPVHAVGAQA